MKTLLRLPSTVYLGEMSIERLESRDRMWRDIAREARERGDEDAARHANEAVYRIWREKMRRA